jgi:hypothetical protein
MIFITTANESFLYVSTFFRLLFNKTCFGAFADPDASRFQMMIDRPFWFAIVDR